MKYGVMLRGENFAIKTEDGVDNLGFFITRIVVANTPKEAELKAVAIVKRDKKLLEILSEKRDFEPQIYLEKIWKERWWKRVGEKGYTFYAMEVNNYIAEDGWSIEIIHNKYYFCSIDSGHGGREYKLEVSNEELKYAHFNKPKFDDMIKLIAKRGYIK